MPAALGVAAAAAAAAATMAGGPGGLGDVGVGAPSAVSAEWAHPQVRGAPPPPCVGHCVARLGVNGLVLFGGFAGGTIGATTTLHPLRMRHPFGCHTPYKATPLRVPHPLTTRLLERALRAAAR